MSPLERRIEPGATLLTRMLSRASCCAIDFREADLRGFDRVVRHPPARFAAPDRRDHHDGSASAAAHMRHGEPRSPDRRKERLVERLAAIRRRWCR